jgi:hypothetical protein
MSNRMLTAAIAGLAALASLTAPAVSPAQAGGVESTSCVGGRTSLSCVTTWRRGGNPNIIDVRPLSEEEIAESKERDRLWRAHCQPIVRQDAHGVERYTYAERGCEYGRYQ